jgi:hypothetical protein
MIKIAHLEPSLPFELDLQGSKGSVGLSTSSSSALAKPSERHEQKYREYIAIFGVSSLRLYDLLSSTCHQ